MKTKKRKLTLLRLVLSLFIVFVSSCSDDDDGSNPDSETVSASDITFNIAENPESNAVIGSFTATSSSTNLSYSIISQSDTGAVNIDEVSGEISVANRALFNFEERTLITLEVQAAVANTNLTAAATVTINITNITPEIWTGADLSFSKDANSDWTLPENQDQIFNNVVFTRQNNRPIYNYQWWIVNKGSDANSNDLSEEFWGFSGGTVDNPNPSGGTKSVRWAILNDDGVANPWDSSFNLYGTLGDPTHFYSFHNIASMIEILNDGLVYPVDVTDDFNIELSDGFDQYDFVVMPELVGINLACMLNGDDGETYYFTFKFTEWGSGGSGGAVAYLRSTP
ncbi:MAG: cadherin repeat domain-containing protein [bacterium]